MIRIASALAAAILAPLAVAVPANAATGSGGQTVVMTSDDACTAHPGDGKAIATFHIGDTIKIRGAAVEVPSEGDAHQVVGQRCWITDMDHTPAIAGSLDPSTFRDKVLAVGEDGTGFILLDAADGLFGADPYKIKSAPSKNADTLATLNGGEVLTVAPYIVTGDNASLAGSTAYAPVDFNGLLGWLPARGLARVPSVAVSDLTTTVQPTVDAQVFSMPTTSSDPVGTLTAGSTVATEPTPTAGWYPVEYTDGEVGWVQAGSLFNESSASASPSGIATLGALPSASASGEPSPSASSVACVDAATKAEIALTPGVTCTTPTASSPTTSPSVVSCPDAATKAKIALTAGVVCEPTAAAANSDGDQNIFQRGWDRITGHNPIAEAAAHAALHIAYLLAILTVVLACLVWLGTVWKRLRTELKDGSGLARAADKALDIIEPAQALIVGVVPLAAAPVGALATAWFAGHAFGYERGKVTLLVLLVGAITAWALAGRIASTRREPSTDVLRRAWQSRGGALVGAFFAPAVLLTVFADDLHVSLAVAVMAGLLTLAITAGFVAKDRSGLVVTAPVIEQTEVSTDQTGAADLAPSPASTSKSAAGPKCAMFVKRQTGTGATAVVAPALDQPQITAPTLDEEPAPGASSDDDLEEF